VLAISCSKLLLLDVNSLALRGLAKTRKNFSSEVKPKASNPVVESLKTFY
jgi:hypothetical protein